MLSNASVKAMLPVVDLNRARKFYEDKLGLKVFEEMEQWISMLDEEPKDSYYEKLN